MIAASLLLPGLMAGILAAPSSHAPLSLLSVSEGEERQASAAEAPNSGTTQAEGADGMTRLRARYQLEPAELSHERPREARFRCAIPDPTCAWSVEVLATSAYSQHWRQGDVTQRNALSGWNTGRAQFDAWVGMPALVENVGRWKYTRMTLGPKGGIAMHGVSPIQAAGLGEGGERLEMWGNAGVGMRWWLGRGAWAPSIEFSSALAFRLRGKRGDSFGAQRSPIGFTADLGVGVGGWGAIVFGGQYEAPLAREELPEKFRIPAGGSVFVGFRGNILWGAPAAAGVTTMALSGRALR